MCYNFVCKETDTLTPQLAATRLHPFHRTREKGNQMEEQTKHHLDYVHHLAAGRKMKVSIPHQTHQHLGLQYEGWQQMQLVYQPHESTWHL